MANLPKCSCDESEHLRRALRAIFLISQTDTSGSLISDLVQIANLAQEGLTLQTLEGDPGVYPTLRDLERLGLLDRREGPSSITDLVNRGGRPVVWYRLTELGAERLARTPVRSTSRKGT